MLSAKGEQDIDKVLVIGEAGAGKSTLVRKLAYIWAMVQGLQEVRLVFVLNVQDLQAQRYNNQ